MIDMHCHILYGVDDGCQSLDASIRMIQKAIEVGVKKLVLTPHYAPMRGYVEPLSIIKDNYRQLKDKVASLQLPITLYLGQEIDYHKELVENLKMKKCLPLNHSKYVLIDFGLQKVNIDEAVYHLVIAGFKPIIAHPERYLYITDHKKYHLWKKTGALLQINASSYYHPHTKQVKRNVKYLIQHDLVDCVASDVHQKPYVYDDLKKMHRVIDKKRCHLKTIIFD
jgi:protein-tyrosine phosphatase